MNVMNVEDYFNRDNYVKQNDEQVLDSNHPEINTHTRREAVQCSNPF